MSLNALTGRALHLDGAAPGPFAARVAQLTPDGPVVAPDAAPTAAAVGPCLGALVVAVGDAVLVAFDDAGVPWILAKG